MAKSAPAPVSVAVLDLKALAGFFRSVALSIEIQANTRLQWKEYRESTVLNIAYALMPWKEGPGMAEINQDWRLISTNADRRSGEMLGVFLDKLHNGGPMAAAGYVDQMDRLRTYTRRAVQELFADASAINAQVAGQAGQAARNLALIQFGCTVLLAATGCYVALGASVPTVLMGGMTATQMAAGVGAINLGYNVVGALVKDAASWSSAKTIAIEVSKDRTGALGSPWFLSRDTAAAQEIGQQQGVLQKAEQDIARYNEKLGRKLGDARRGRYARNLARQQAAAEEAGKRIARGEMTRTGARMAMKAIPVVFLAHDLYNAWSDLSDTWQATR